LSNSLKQRPKWQKKNIIDKMFNAFKFNPRGVAQFFEEFLENEKDKQYMEKIYEKYSNFIRE